jgi:hypothetical protein
MKSNEMFRIKMPSAKKGKKIVPNFHITFLRLRHIRDLQRRRLPPACKKSILRVEHFDLSTLYQLSLTFPYSNDF